jgi:hypothetical protein
MVRQGLHLWRGPVAIGVVIPKGLPRVLIAYRALPVRQARMVCRAFGVVLALITLIGPMP